MFNPVDGRLVLRRDTFFLDQVPILLLTDKSWHRSSILREIGATSPVAQVGLVDYSGKHASPMTVQDNGRAGGNGPEHSRRLQFAMRALGRTAVTLGYQAMDLTYEWAENLPRGIDAADVIGHRDANFLPPRAAERLQVAKQQVMRSGETRRIELPVTIAGELRWFDIWIDPDTGEDGDAGVIGVFSTIIDISAQKQREVQLRNLLREVSHRSRNLLAIVLSLASQTARSATTIPGFISAFSGRLQAIARAQDLITDRDWQGALLSDLISRQVALFHKDSGLPVELRGDDLMVSPNAALYVGLAIHELAANAVRNGQLAAPDGAIDIAFDLEADQDGKRSITVTWSEQLDDGADAEPIEDLTRKFLESVVPLAVDGAGKLTVDSGSIAYTLRIDGSHIT